MISVVFVDDEAAILDGLRRGLRRARPQWSCRFAVGGQDALSAMESLLPQVLVSDVRMPGMDGQQLLERVSRHWPQVVRIVLSGFNDQEEALRMAGLAHQFLAKPCDLDHLIAVIERAVAVERDFANPDLGRLLRSVCDLPAHQDHIQALQAELQQGDPDGDRLAAIIAEDPALSAKVLKIANAPLLCPIGSAGTIRQAIAVLGIERLRSLSLVLGFFSYQDPVLSQRLDLELWYRRATLLGRLAVGIAAIEDCDRVLCAQVATAAPLLDIGMLALALADPDRYDAIFILDEAILLERERAAYGCDHAAAGAFLAGLWNLPLSLREAIRNHTHLPEHDGSGFDLVTLCACAAALYEEHYGCSGTTIDRGYLTRIGRHHHVQQWRDLAATVEAES